MIKEDTDFQTEWHYSPEDARLINQANFVKIKGKVLVGSILAVLLIAPFLAVISLVLLMQNTNGLVISLWVWIVVSSLYITGSLIQVAVLKAKFSKSTPEVDDVKITQHTIFQGADNTKVVHHTISQRYDKFELENLISLRFNTKISPYSLQFLKSHDNTSSDEDFLKLFTDILFGPFRLIALPFTLVNSNSTSNSFEIYIPRGKEEQAKQLFEYFKEYYPKAKFN